MPSSMSGPEQTTLEAPPCPEMPEVDTYHYEDVDLDKVLEALRAVRDVETSLRGSRHFPFPGTDWNI